VLSHHTEKIEKGLILDKSALLTYRKRCFDILYFFHRNGDKRFVIGIKQNSVNAVALPVAYHHFVVKGYLFALNGAARGGELIAIANIRRSIFDTDGEYTHKGLANDFHLTRKRKFVGYGEFIFA
jgi:hypothetical protein